MTRMDGFSALTLLSELDDGMILEATLPEPDSVRKRPRRDRAPGALARFMNSGWAAAIISVTVALAVLAGIVAAGRMGASMGTPPPGSDAGMQGGRPGPGMQGSSPNLGTEAEVDSDIQALPPSFVIDGGLLSGSSVTVTSDGQTVKLSGVLTSLTSHWAENGWPEIDYKEAPGLGGRLPELAAELPVLRTAGGRFALHLPTEWTLEQMQIYNHTFDSLELVPMLPEDGSLPDLAALSDGTYYVILQVAFTTVNSPEEWKMGTFDYGFCLIKDSRVDEDSPARIQSGLKTYFLANYPLQKTYYDAELGQEIVEDYVGAEAQLPQLIKRMQTATVVQGESLSLYLAPHYELSSIKVWSGPTTLWGESSDEEMLTLLPTWEADDYYVIVTAVYVGTGMTEVVQFPLHVVLVEETISPETEGPVVEWGTEFAPDPRILLEGHYTAVSFLDEWNGYRLWSEEWHDGAMISGDSIGAEGQLAELFASGELDAYNLVHTVNTPLNLLLNDERDALTRVTVYDKDLNYVASAQNFTAIHERPAGTYIVILAVTTTGDYIPEADAYERYCTEYAFIMELYS